jgi:isocitrate/isopropylmalate dehydrogenase
MMLEFLGETDAANRVRAAVDKSDDVNGSTAEIGDAIAGKLRRSGAELGERDGAAQSTMGKV